MAYKKVFLLALLWWAPWDVGVSQTDSPDPWKAGLNAYDHGDYKEAIHIWESLRIEMHKWEQGNLLYNLGNAYFREHELGKAHAALIAAERLLPRSPEVRANLKFVSAAAKDMLVARSPEESFLFWQDWVSDQELQIAEFIFGAMSLLCWGIWLAQRRRGTALKVAIWGMLISGFCECLVVIPWSLRMNQWGAVIPDKIQVHSGPSEATRTLFELHSGAPVRQVAEEDGWVRVVLSDGKQGWLKGSEIAIFH